MPVTTFHFGPGALLKALVPRWISLTAFVISQVVIDLESGYHLLRQEWPIHRHLHSLVLAGVAGLLSGTLVFLAAQIANRGGLPCPGLRLASCRLTLVDS